MSYYVLWGRKEWNADGTDEMDMYELNHKEKGYLTANPTSLKLRRTSERELARIWLKNRDMK